MSETSTYRTELVTRLRLATDDLAWAVRGLRAEEFAYKPDEREWSIHEHLSHLRDMEREVYLPLLRWAVVPDMLDPLDYNRREWHEHRYDPEEAPGAIVEELLRIRDEELLIFRDMDDVTWTRYHTATRWGPLTCQWLAELMYRHVLDHLQGIMGLRQDLHLAERQPRPAGVGGQTVSEKRGD